jgi:hypothetical protein
VSVDDALARLMAGLDEDERIARTADHTRWLPEAKGVSFEHYDTESGYAGYVAADTSANMNHIAHFGPKRALRQIEALRLVADLYETEAARPQGTDPAAQAYANGYLAACRWIVKILACIYTEDTVEGTP